ncbi:hypothetical protein D3C78_1244420 [compost metagenome]
MLHPQQALHQVELEVFHRRQLAQCVAQQAFLRGAVHRFDAQAAPAQLGIARQALQLDRSRARRMGVVVAAGVVLAHGVASDLTCWQGLHTL